MCAMQQKSWAIGFGLLLLACGDTSTSRSDQQGQGSSPPLGGINDASVNDARAAEAGAYDASAPDTGAVGVGAVDAGPITIDAGPMTTPGGGTDAGPGVIGPVQQPDAPGPADVALEVHADQARHAISALIYGTNGAPDLAHNRQTLVRSGGNRLTAYNWENNASNAGSDWMYQNDDFMSSSEEPAKPIIDAVHEAAQNGAASIVTVPLVDYVAADKAKGGDVRNSGADYLAKRFRQNKPAKGAAFGPSPDTADAFVYQDEFVAYLLAKVGQAKVLFSLDNEPDLWSSTHAEVHPKPVTYAELWDRTQRFSSAIKKVAPGAAVLGPVSYGYNGYVSLQNASDANGRDFLEWYLDQAKAAEAQHGRLIDYLDLHWYPEAKGGGTRITEASTDPKVVAAREQAPRSLWDDSYAEESWIHDVLGEPIDLLHRLVKKIDAHYPGTQLAITEWNYGGGGHISGAIAVADVLGIFGREGVDLACYWALSDNEQFAYAAFRAYRNFDGQGGSFGDTSVQASSDDPESVTFYASLSSSDPNKVVLIAINKAGASKTAALRLYHSSAFRTLKVYRLSAENARVMPQADQASAGKNAFLLNLPAQTVSVLVPIQ